MPPHAVIQVHVRYMLLHVVAKGDQELHLYFNTCYLKISHGLVNMYACMHVPIIGSAGSLAACSSLRCRFVFEMVVI